MLPSKRVLVLADLHCGSGVGLAPPEYWRDKFRPFQEPLWNWYAEEIKSLGPVDLLVVNGDAVDGEGRAETLDHLTTDTEEQADIAAACIKRVKAKKILMTYGTPFHTAGSYSYENLVAKTLDAPIADTQFVSVNGRRFSFRHVVGASGTPYTQGTQAYKEAVRDMFQAVDNEAEPAEYIIRSHVHNCFVAASPERTAITTPCLEIPVSVFGRRCRAWRYHVGFLEFVVSQDGLVWYDIGAHIMPLKLTRPREYIAI